MLKARQGKGHVSKFGCGFNSFFLSKYILFVEIDECEEIEHSD